MVSVLFCDLVGSTARAERLDPEDVRALLSRYHTRVRAELERFGGTVEKFIGDAVVALFGAPVTHEDDAERAVRAALSVRDWVADEADLHLRIAVNTGEALISLDAQPAAGEGMASGDVVNTAARLQAAAPVDGVIVGEQTFRATERAIEYRPLEPVVAKGKAEALPVWEVVKPRSRFGVDLSRPSRAPLVGRARERELLLSAFGRARDDEAPQLVTLVGVPGIGKTRLVAELFAEIERDERLVTWRQGRSLPYGEGVSYWALGEIVKAHAGILDTDAPPAAAAKLEAAVAQLFGDPADTAWVETRLRPLAGLTTEAGSRGESFAAWQRFFEAIAHTRPLVLVFEDLHWAGDDVLDFVDHLAERVTNVPLLIVATARPELLARRPAWGGGKANAATISLGSLSDEDTTKLMHALLEEPLASPELSTKLLERAGGNPLYAEEFVRMVSEGADDHVELPDSVQGIIAARLDLLDPEEKGLLQNASVVGKVFWSGALARVGESDRFDVEERLHALERRELVRRERQSSVEGENEFAFAHALVRDVAYATIPRAARVDRHRRAAEWIESLGRPDDHAELLAHHYRSALDLASAAGLDSAEALRAAAASALVRAGDRAFALKAFESASRFYEEAAQLGISEELLPGMLLRQGAALHQLTDLRSADVLDEARPALIAAGDLEAAAEASMFLANEWWQRGDSKRAWTEVERAQELLDGRAASATAARVHAQISRQAVLASDNETAIAEGRRALEIAAELGSDEVVPVALNNIGVARVNVGDYGGFEDLERAIELGLASNHVDTARAYINLASSVGPERGLDEVRRLLSEAIVVGRRFGNMTSVRHGVGNLMRIDYESGHWADALATAESVIAEAEAGLPQYHEANAHAVRASILHARGDDAGAAAALERALARGRQAADPQVLVPIFVTGIRIHRENGAHDQALAAAHEILALERGTELVDAEFVLHVDPLGLHDSVPPAIERMAHAREREIAALLLTGRLGPAADVLVSLQRNDLAARVRLEAARDLAAQGDRAAADRALAWAPEFFRSVDATRYVQEVDAIRVG